MPVTGAVVDDGPPIGDAWPGGGGDGAPALPAGFTRVVGPNPEVWHSLKEGDFVVNLGDLRDTKPTGLRNGCCGPDGLDGPNLACANGHPVGTEVADCWTAHFAHLDPSRVTCAPVVDEGDGPVRSFGVAPPCTTEWEFVTWLHEALDSAAWHGGDLESLLAAYAGPPVTIRWVGAERSRKAGVPVERLRRRVMAFAPRVRLFLA